MSERQPKSGRTRNPPDSLWPVYAFRTEGGDGWTLVASKRRSDHAREDALTRFSTIEGWRETGHQIYSPITSGLWIVREDQDYDVCRLPDEQSFVWDPYALVWRAYGEPLSAPPYAEQVEHVTCEFGQPDVGWIKLRLSTARQSLSLPLSAVFDPFDDIMDWLRRVIAHDDARLVINTEGTLALLHVLTSENRRIFVVGRPIWGGHRDFIVEMPRINFVSDIYSALVPFWEGEELKRNWTEWLTDLKDSESREDYDPKYWQPWPIRSAVVERYLASAA